MKNKDIYNENKYSETKLLQLLNDFLNINSKARRLQINFENSLAAFIGFERADLSEVMDTYIDLDISGSRSATLENLRQIIIEAMDKSK